MTTATMIQVIEAVVLIFLGYRVWIQYWTIQRLDQYQRKIVWLENLHTDALSQNNRLHDMIAMMYLHDNMVRIADAAYTAGTRRDDTWSTEKWIAETFKQPETVNEKPVYVVDAEKEKTIREWAAQYHADLKAGKKTY